jgi:prevent-host-death family protein
MAERQPMTQTMKASEAKQRWGGLLTAVFKGEKRVLVEKSGIPVAAVISAADFQRLQRLEAQRDLAFTALDESWKAFAGVSLDDMEEQVANAVAEARAELRQEANQRAGTP